jgi:UDP-N-acetylmuramyl pentapeptide phosphotransferase/UDP-N-acetylglucosamine-1-phosphate transferase
MSLVLIFFASVTAFMLVYYSIPMIIRVANNNQLYDSPDGKRKVHSTNTPRLGGVSVFGAIVLSLVCWIFAFEQDLKLHFIAPGLIILFFTGLRDDIADLKPKTKLSLQLLAIALFIFGADIRIHSFYGIFGLQELPYWFSVMFTFFCYVVIINAMNLIDGIDGLAGGLAAIVSITYGVWFYLIGQQMICLIAFIHAAAQVAFLRFNISQDPRLRIFMGDCGSMIAGGIIAVLTIRFIETTQGNIVYFLSAGPSVALGIVIIPLFDTLRVFVIRVSKGKSPFTADRNHLHHLFIDMGLTHRVASAVLYGINIGFITLSLSLAYLPIVSHLLIIFFSGIVVLNLIPSFLVWLRRKRLPVLVEKENPLGIDVEVGKS